MPLGIDESDLVMLLLSIFLLALLVIVMFIVLGWFLALLATFVIVGAIYYGVRELRRQESESEKKEL